MRVLNSAFNHSLKNEENAAMPLAGGIVQHGYQCGMIWGASLAAGAQAYRLLGQGPRAETKAIIAAQRLVESFRVLNRDINCLELTGIDKSSSVIQMINYFLIRGGTISCFRKAARYAQESFGEINTALSKEHFEVSLPPVSCTAILAKKMGLSDIQTVMVAGLAGGIGLSGGACGALGAAIWIIGMKSLKEEGEKLDYKSPRALDAIDTFLKCTEFEFECCKIVGRRFENVGDHASHMRNGGCSKIIEVLAAKLSTG